MKEHLLKISLIRKLKIYKLIPMIKKFLRQIKSKLGKFINLFAFFCSGTYFTNKRKLQLLKDMYKEQRCFVVCNGPSLRPDDLTNIYKKGFVSIGMNQIAYIYDKTPWRLNVLVLTDACAFWPRSKKMIQECEAYIKVFKREDYFKSLSYKGNKVYVKVDTSYSLLDNSKFSMDLSEICYCIGTTTYESIEWARYLGCKEIYIIGCDMSYAVNQNRDGSIYYNTTGTNHFYGKDKDELSAIKPVQTWQQKTAYAFAEKFSRINGFRIYNATRGGFLEEFERVDLDSLL